MTLIEVCHTAAPVREMREIAWSSDAGEEVAEIADEALRRFARENSSVLASPEFLELVEYLETQPDDEAKTILHDAGIDDC